MKLYYRDFPGKWNALKSIEVQGDTLLWRYQSGFFTQNASLGISSIVSVSLDNNELVWTYRLIVKDGSAKTSILSETLCAAGESQDENEYLARIHCRILEAINSYASNAGASEEKDSSRRTSRKHSETDAENSQREYSDKGSNYQERHAQRNAGSKSESSRDQSESQSSYSATPASRNDLRKALCLIGGGLAKEKKRKIKSTLRMVHHPDHGGNQDFFIQLESVLIELEW